MPRFHGEPITVNDDGEVFTLAGVHVGWLAERQEEFLPVVHVTPPSQSALRAIASKHEQEFVRILVQSGTLAPPSL